MNLTDKNLDKFFKDAAMHSKAPEYKDAYWDEFESILNTQQKKKGGLWIWFSAGTLMFALLSSLLFIESNTSELRTAKQDTKNDSSKLFNTHKTNTSNKSTPSVYAKKKDLRAKNVGLEKALVKSTLPNAKRRVSQYNSQKGINNTPKIATNTVITNEKTDKIKTPVQAELRSINTPEVNTLKVKKESLHLFSLSEQQGLKPLTQLQRKKGWRFYAQFNFGLSEAYNENILDRSLTTNISLNAERKFAKLVLRSGLGLAATTNSAIAFADRSKVYGYSSNSYSHHIIYDNLYELYVPLELGVELKGYTFGAGVSANYLLGTTLHFTSTEDEKIVIDENYKNIKEGLNNLSFSGHLFVDKTLTNHISLGAKVGTLLTDRYAKENVFEFGENLKNPLFGQLYLKLNF